MTGVEASIVSGMLSSGPDMTAVGSASDSVVVGTSAVPSSRQNFGPTSG